MKKLFILLMALLPLAASGQKISNYVASGDTVTVMSNTSYMEVSVLGTPNVTKAIRMKPLFDAKQPLEATLTDIADGTISENLVNTANPWADNEVSNDLTITKLELVLADTTLWNVLDDSIAAHVIILNTHEGRLDNLDDSVAAHVVILNTHEGRLDAVDDSLALHIDTLNAHNGRLDDIENDLVGIYNVMDYGAVGDGVANDQVAVQTAIDSAADYGTVVFPSGVYLVDSITVSNSQTLRGLTTGLDAPASIIKGKRNKPVVHVYADNGAGAYGTMYETKIENLVIKGSAHADSSSQHGIVVNGSARLVVRDVFVYGVGGYAVYIASKFATDVCRFDNVTAQHCHLGGVKMNGAYSCNAITFDKCNFTQNYGYGMWVAGTNVNILNSVIQGNDSSGIFINNFAVGATAAITNLTISGNYFELNGGGSIYAAAGLVSGQAYVISGLTIEKNYMYENSTSIDKPEVTACLTLAKGPGSSAVFYYDNVEIGNNHYTSTGLTNFDGNDVIDQYTSVYINNGGAAEFVGLGYCTKIFLGVTQIGSLLATPTASGGITAAMLSPNIYLYLEAAVNITANPQIAAGYDGQEITIKTMSDTYTLTLDDGTGLELSAQWVGGANDMITLVYDTRWGDNVWCEKSRSNN